MPGDCWRMVWTLAKTARRQKQLVRMRLLILSPCCVMREGQIAQSTVEKARSRLKNDVLPWIGEKSVASLTGPVVFSVMRRIDARGSRYTAHKVKSEIRQIIRYAIATGRAERDPCPDLLGDR